jgi:hypothetical protein
VVRVEALKKETHMDVLEQPDGKVKYTTPPRVQVWFLGRSRARWKQKYKDLKVEAKRLQNRVHDVTKSREKWRDEAEQLRQRVGELEAQNAALHEQAAALKKDGPDADRCGKR